MRFNDWQRSMIANLEKAAIILMSLPEDEAAAVMGKLGPKDVETVSLQIAQLGRFTSHDQEEAIMAFSDANPHALGGRVGGLDAAKALLERALGAEASRAVQK